MKAIVCTCIALLVLELTGCNKPAPPVPVTKPDTITPAPVRPGDPATPAVPGPNPQIPMPDVNKK